MEQEKTVLLVTNHFPFGSGEEFLETEIQYLNKNFARVIILSQNSKDDKTREVPEGIEIYRCAISQNCFSYLNAIKCLSIDYLWKELKIIKGIYNLNFSPGIFKGLLAAVNGGNQLKECINKIVSENKIQTDNLYLYSYWYNKAAFALALYKKENPAVKAFTRAHGYDIYFERRKNKYLPLKKFTLDNLDRIFFISEDGRSYLEEKLSYKNDRKFKVKRLGINNSYQQARPSRDQTFRLISCSSISTVKRVELIIKSLSLIEDFNVQWTHLGGGVNYPEIKELAEKLLADKSNISFEFKGHLPNPEVYEFYQDREIDALINVSSSEGIPVTIMEAFSFAVPVIATDVGGVSELVNAEKGVLLSSDPSTEEIAGAVTYFYYLARSEIIGLRSKAYQTWLEKYNAEINYNHFIDEIKRIGKLEGIRREEK